MPGLETPQPGEAMTTGDLKVHQLEEAPSLDTPAGATMGNSPSLDGGTNSESGSFSGVALPGQTVKAPSRTSAVATASHDTHTIPLPSIDIQAATSDAEEISSQAEEQTTLRSGMTIPKSPVRDEMWTISLAAARDKSAVRYEEANKKYASFGDIDGIKILEATDMATLKPYDLGKQFATPDTCLQFTFGDMKQEDWAVDQKPISTIIWDQSQRILHDHGYDIVDEPQAGDVVAYTDVKAELMERGQGRFNHFGILAPDGTVVSRFGRVLTVRHDMEQVPSIYGDSVYFLRNSQNDTMPTTNVEFDEYLQQVLQSRAGADTKENAVSEDSRELYSGMNLEEDSIRAEVDEIFKRIDDAMSIDIDKAIESGIVDIFDDYKVLIATCDCDLLNRLADAVATIEDIEVLRSSDYGGDPIAACEWFAFGIMLQENWAQSEVGLNEFVQGDMVEFLLEKGYGFVEREKPAVGDVVAYQSRVAVNEEEDAPSFSHFGILGPDGKVVSKFGLGPVAVHEIDAVPSRYGDSVLFLRRLQDNPIPKEEQGFESYLQHVLQPANQSGDETPEKEVVSFALLEEEAHANRFLKDG